MKVGIAINRKGEVQEGHFGEAAKYLIYEITENSVVLENTIENSLMNFDENSHGSEKKGKGVVGLLQSTGIKAAVSQQFGKNIQILNKHFAPVHSRTKDVEKVLTYIQRNHNAIAFQTEQVHFKAIKIP